MGRWWPTIWRSLRLERTAGRVVGAQLEDRLTGERGVVRASVVVNATGPWAAGAPAGGCGRGPLLQPTKGVHVVVDRSRLDNREAIAFTSPIDGRVMFVLPWGDLSYIGTTDSDTDEPPDDLSVTADDIVYLLRSANARFPSARLSVEDVRATWAGLRPLLADQGRSASNRSREHAIVQGSGGMLTVVGGKLTTYRAMAAEVVDLAMRELRHRDGRQRHAEARTDEEPLPGGETADLSQFRERGLELGIPPASVDHLLRHYGTEAAGIFNLAGADRRLLPPVGAAPGHRSGGDPRGAAGAGADGGRCLGAPVSSLLRAHGSRRLGRPPGSRADVGRVGWDPPRIEEEAERYWSS